MKQKTDTALNKALLDCKSAFFSALIYSMLINLLMLTPSIYMLQVYDRVVSTGNKSTLLMLTLIVFALFVTMSLLEWVRSQLLIRTSAKLETLLNHRIFVAAYKQSLFSSGQRAASQPLDDLHGLRQFLTGNGLFAFLDAPWLPFYIILLFMFHVWYGWFAIIVGIILTVLAIANELATASKLEDAAKLGLSNRAQINQNFKNAEVIESMGMLKNIHQRWLENAYRVLLIQSEASFKAGLISTSSKVVRLTSQSLMLGLGAYLVIEREITPGLMIAGSILLGRAMAPIDMMIGGWKGFINARGQYRRLQEVLQEFPAETEKMTLLPPSGQVSFEKVSILPPGGKQPVLKSLSMSIDSGDLIGVIGASGAGKTSFARAILGVWPASTGTVRMDGADILNWNRDELGEYIGYLPQDVELFDGGIAENIARFGYVDAEKVIQAATLADVHELILRLPEGYDTVIRANGGSLSGGQRQRIGLARALYGNPRLVVLDEPNSSLDEQGEAALNFAIAGLKARGATTILISHNQSFLTKADKWLVLNEGQLALYGSREQVIGHIQKMRSEVPPASANER